MGRILKSAKWNAILGASIVLAVLMALGYIRPEEFMNALKWLVAIGVGATAAEDVAAKIGGQKVEPPV